MSGKLKSSGKIIWLHDDKVINYGDENAKKFIFVFSKAVKHLETPEFKDFDFTAECIFSYKKFLQSSKCTCLRFSQQ